MLQSKDYVLPSTTDGGAHGIHAFKDIQVHI